MGSMLVSTWRRHFTNFRNDVRWFRTATLALRAERSVNARKWKTNPYDEDLRSIKALVRILLGFAFGYYFKVGKCSSYWDFLRWRVQKLGRCFFFWMLLWRRSVGNFNRKAREYYRTDVPIMLDFPKLQRPVPDNISNKNPLA